MKTDTLLFFVKDVLVACSLLTRLPMPSLSQSAFAASRRAVWAYPLAGALIGFFAGGLGSLALYLGLPSTIAAGLVLIVLCLLTGAMHEDGLADTVDGFWGANTAQKRLAIMKDSQIGTYGTLALILVTGFRWLAYSALLPLGLWSVVITAALSRALMPVLMWALPHARDFGLSHSVGRPRAVVVLVGLGLSLALGATTGLAIIPAVLASGLAVAGLSRLALRKIGGQTGDVLGTAQQLAEVVILCSLVMALT